MPILRNSKTDIRDMGDSYLLEADLPGFNKNDINVELNGDTLTIFAERHSENETKDKKRQVRLLRAFIRQVQQRI